MVRSFSDYFLGNSKVLAIAVCHIGIIAIELKADNIQAHDNEGDQIFFVACGIESQDHKFSVVVWKAEEPRGRYIHCSHVNSGFAHNSDRS